MNMSLSIPIGHEGVTGYVKASETCVHVHIDEIPRPYDTTRVSLYGHPSEVLAFLKQLTEEVQAIVTDAWCDKTDSISY